MKVIHLRSSRLSPGDIILTLKKKTFYCDVFANKTAACLKRQSNVVLNEAWVSKGLLSFYGRSE